MKKEDIYFPNMLSIAKKHIYNRFQKIKILNFHIHKFSIYIREFNAMNPNLSIDELQKELIKDFENNLSANISDSNNYFEQYMDLNSCKYLQKNPETFDILMKKVSSSKYTPISNKETFSDYLESYVYSFFKRKDDIIRYCFEKFDRNMIQAFQKSKNPNEIYKEVEKYIKHNIKNNYLQKKLFQGLKVLCFGFKHYLQVEENIYEKQLKIGLKDSILALTSTLKKMGSYKYYNETNKSNFSEFKFSQFQENNDGKYMYSNLQETPYILDSLSTDELMILYTYWINRFSKEMISYSNFLCAIKELNLLPDIIQNKQIVISEDLQKKVFEKTYTLYPIIYAAIGGTDIKNWENENDFSQHYHDYFKYSLPQSSNIAKDDLPFYRIMISPIMIAYAQKNVCLCGLITNIGNESNIKNAGIIPDEYSEDKSKIIISSPYIGLGIDSNLTFPVKAHVSLDILKNFVKSFSGSTIVPVYMGIEDFYIPGTHQIMSSQLVLPFTSKQKDLLKKQSKNSTPLNKNFIQHLLFLSNSSKLPDSISKTEIDKRGKVKRTFERLFVDLETGKLYTQDENGKLVRKKPEKRIQHKASKKAFYQFVDDDYR